MTSNRVPSLLPQVTEHILPYYQRMVVMKRVDGLVQLKKWQVLHAKAYKSRATAARHEYISAAVVDTHDPNRKITFIAIERGRGDTTNTNTETQNGSFSSFKLNPSSSSVSDSISPTRLANDKISPMSSEMRKKDDELIYSLDFKNSKPLFLYELAILALVVHEENTSYMLMKNNCYHFAGIIMRVLKEGYDTVNVVEYAGGARKWCGIVIYDGEGYYNLLEKFKTNIKDFESLPMSLEARYEDLGADIAALRAKEPQSMNLETDVAELRAKEFQLMNLETEVAQLRLRAAACGSGTPGQ